MTLIHAGLAPASLEQARIRASSAAQFLERLSAQGELSSDRVQQLLRWRLTAGLMPIFDRSDGVFRLIESGVEAAFVPPGCKTTTVSVEILHRLDVLGNYLTAPYSPSEVFAVLTSDGDAGTLMAEDWRLLAALGEGMTLQEAAKRTNLAWDELLLSLRKLENRGLIGHRGNRRKEARYRGARLVPGDLAPAFALPAHDGRIVSLGRFRGHRTLLRFGRQAGCPFCNPRHQQLIEAWPALQAAGIEVVSVFGSSMKALQERVGTLRPPFPLLSDPEDRTYRLYGVGRSLLGLFHPRNLPILRRGLSLESSGGGLDGEAIRMPAEFLIGPDLRIERAHYYRYLADFLPLDEAIAWAASSAHSSRQQTVTSDR